MLLFTAGIFLIALLTFKDASFPNVKDVSSTNKIKILSFTHVTYRKNLKKIVAPYAIWKLLFLVTKNIVIPVA
ncbi:hypothetical protein [Clostridium hominis]|uniref:hypothetical protein n=1 Tax=Clostridium hominis TaxID=2763036 RepID=UPI001A9BDF52|nr:hypothetical protein [Clostridium hominis]